MAYVKKMERDSGGKICADGTEAGEQASRGRLAGSRFYGFPYSVISMARLQKGTRSLCPAVSMLRNHGLA